MLECLKLFMVKILRIEQKSVKTSKFSPLKINPLYDIINDYNICSAWFLEN